MGLVEDINASLDESSSKLDGLTLGLGVVADSVNSLEAEIVALKDQVAAGGNASLEELQALATKATALKEGLDTLKTAQDVVAADLASTEDDS